MLKEIIRIANLLDKKGLMKEASTLDSLLQKIAQYDDTDDYDDELSEDAKLAIKSFIEKHLNPASSVDPASEVLILDMLHSDSRELKEYAEEHLPDAIFDLSADVNMMPNKLYKEIIDEAQFSEKYGKNSDFKYLIDAVRFYLDDYQF
tara:strand:- start:3155 stop:3598 length:444 start_codon:yes stop_codon:yes gene_type:complete